MNVTADFHETHAYLTSLGRTCIPSFMKIQQMVAIYWS